VLTADSVTTGETKRRAGARRPVTPIRCPGAAHVHNHLPPNTRIAFRFDLESHHVALVEWLHHHDTLQLSTAPTFPNRSHGAHQRPAYPIYLGIYFSCLFHYLGCFSLYSSASVLNVFSDSSVSVSFIVAGEYSPKTHRVSAKILL